MHMYLLTGITHVHTGSLGVSLAVHAHVPTHWNNTCIRIYRKSGDEPSCTCTLCHWHSANPPRGPTLSLSSQAARPWSPRRLGLPATRSPTASARRNGSFLASSTCPPTCACRHVVFRPVGWHLWFNPFNA